jgi:galactitol-specific phosphotransferase system IIC component
MRGFGLALLVLGNGLLASGAWADRWALFVLAVTIAVGAGLFTWEETS